ncbi:MAG TPA: phosphomannomutase/phosphoglucomutase [archaeon]|nr:phosphomannomutase/phosphoglucomutase [archaeon]
MGIFRPYDIRGIYPTEINEKIAHDLGKAFATYIARVSKKTKPTIAVGRDTRIGSESMMKEFIKGLVDTGCTVIDVAETTTPMMIFIPAFYKLDGGAIITASHNPKEYNGVKFTGQLGKVIGYENGLKDVQEIFDSKTFRKGSGKVEKIDAIKEYSDFLLSKMGRKKFSGMKVVFDAGNGVTGLIYPKILSNFGIELIELNCKPDGNFPNRDPDPNKKGAMQKLQEKVVEEGADLGIATDADGDRLVIVDEKGSIIEPREVFGMLIRHVLKKNRGSRIVHDVLSSSLIEKLIKSNGGIPVVCKVGRAFIYDALVKENGFMAGEISGHYFFKDVFNADDSLYASLKLMEYVTSLGKKLSECRDFPKYYYEEMRVLINADEKQRFVESLKKDFISKGYKVDTLDGVKVNLDCGWALFRPSNTEPKISLAFESNSQKDFEKLKSFVEVVVSKMPR